MNNISIKEKETKLFNKILYKEKNIYDFRHPGTRIFHDNFLKFFQEAINDSQEQILSYMYPQLVLISRNFKKHKNTFKQMLNAGDYDNKDNLSNVFFSDTIKYIFDKNSAIKLLSSKLLDIVSSNKPLWLDFKQILTKKKDDRNLFTTLFRKLKQHLKEDAEEIIPKYITEINKVEHLIEFDRFFNLCFSELELKQQWRLLSTNENINYHLYDNLIVNIRTSTNIFSRPIQEGSDKYFMFSLVNLTEKYLDRFNMTALIGYVYRALEEYRFQNPNLDEPLSEEQINTKKEILKFLDTMFEFDPNFHVKSALTKNSKDKSRSAKMEVNNSEADYAKIKIPPKDTFHRYTHYKEANYDELREITNNIYHEKPDLEWCIFPYTACNTLEECERFRKKYEKEVITSIIVAKGWNWTFMGSQKKNRNIIDIYNEETEILKKIVDNIKEESKFGRDLLKKRVEIKRGGRKKQLSENLEEYKKFRNPFGDSGVKSIDELITSDELSNTEKEDEPCPKDLIEVNVTEIKNNPSNRIGENSGFELRKSKFFTEQIHNQKAYSIQSDQ
jgi:hypothetical protein